MLRPTKNNCRSIFLIVLLPMVIQALSYTSALADVPPSRLVKDHLKKRVELASTQERFRCRGELICGVSQIPLFYQRRGFRPAWCSEKGISPQAEYLIGEIKRADTEGLRPEDYHLAAILSLSDTIENIQSMGKKVHPGLWADLDLILTDAFMLYASHLYAGRVNPETVHSDWTVSIQTIDLTNILQLAAKENQIEKVFTGFSPNHPGYSKLKAYLARYRSIEKKFQELPLLDLPLLRKGDQGRSVEDLCKRLIIFGDLHPDKRSRADIFDETVERAVLECQKRHGLKQDGIVGPQTLGVLNTPLQKRIRQIELNMERWRWIPRDIGDRYLIVNIADFKLWVSKEGSRALDMRVVVGRPFRRTPVFSSRMTSIVINPYWHIPPRLAIEDILPEIKKSYQYIEDQKIKVFKDWSSRSEEMDPKAIDWNRIEPANFTYKLRQEPGPRNALGLMKFIFPNKFAVYLHDTPERSLFRETHRDFSSGCIRVEKPVSLAACILGGDPLWTREKIVEVLKSGMTQVVKIRKPIRVHIQYWTAWVDETGRLNFRHDIYNRDEPLDRALKERGPRTHFTPLY
ncbi:MAG: L,D-transpeptidase family protein [Thermodesulfobacteriota bacterium]|nr:L,D-transpeptidase family protein [Thermodesulfobacteriota bacterium]